MYVTIGKITEVNSSIRLFRLNAVNGSPLHFLPGQWLDTFVPGSPKPGGFTITSAPRLAQHPPSHVELAVQRSPTNPPAAWLFQPTADIVGQTLNVCVGGSFVWPPAHVPVDSLRNVVFVAGGVGINPLMSIVSHLAGGESPPPFNVHFMYSTKIPSEAWEDGRLCTDRILFLDQLLQLFSKDRVNGQLSLFLTGDSHGGGSAVDIPWSANSQAKLRVVHRRIGMSDLEEALGSEQERNVSVAYVCGVPAMTDDFTEQLVSPTGLGMEKDRVLYEKWW
ncbi:hypothetical protein ACHAQA_006016 [Verticillium albo-atrum]